MARLKPPQAAAHVAESPMAKRKVVSSSRPGSGESKTGMVVSIVLFIFLTIGLGVTTYLGYSGKSEAEGKISQAESKASTETKKAQEEEALNATLRIALGADTDANRTLFSGRKSTNSAKIQEQVNALKAFQGPYRWDVTATANRPPKNYSDLLAESQQAALAKEREAKVAENNLAEARKQFEADKQEQAAKQKETEKKLAE